VYDGNVNLINLEVCICFSVQVDKDIKKLSQRFKATISESSYSQFKALCEYEKEIGLEATEKILGMKRHPRRKAPIFKTPGEDSRIYSNYFTDVIMSDEGKRTFGPMRYRVRPAGSQKEIPTKYNVYNARLDALEDRQTWSSLIGRNHGLLPFVQFFEWVKNRGSSKEIIFSPDHYEIMWAPCLWDEWRSADDKVSFKSFALITDNPPREISENGHDRCPIFLKEDLIDDWLNPQAKSMSEIYEILKEREKVYFNHSWSA